MKFLTHHHKRIRATFIITSLSVFVLGLFLLPNFTTYSSEGKNTFTLWILGEDMGTVDSVEKADAMLVQAREQLAKGQKNLYMVENLHKEIVGEESIYKQVDDEDQVYAKILKTFKDHQKETMTRAYMVKVNNTTVNLASSDEVNELLTRAIDKYDENDEYEVRTEINSASFFFKMLAVISTR